MFDGGGIALGTHIDAFFPHTVERSPEAIQGRLVKVFTDLHEELAAIRERGRFSADDSNWSCWSDEGTISGEGLGFSINVYRAVTKFTSLERFCAIESPDLGIDRALQSVFEAVATAFGAGGQLAVAAGGFGDTDRTSDLAFEGRGFADVCHSLAAVIGPPVRSWDALRPGAGFWFLSPAAPDPARDAGS